MGFRTGNEEDPAVFWGIRGAHRLDREDKHSSGQYPFACPAQERFSHEGPFEFAS